MEKAEKKKWTKFRESKSSKILKDEVELIARLHAKYFKHKYKVPCSCSPKTIEKWIQQLNDVYEQTE